MRDAIGLSFCRRKPPSPFRRHGLGCKKTVLWQCKGLSECIYIYTHDFVGGLQNKPVEDIKCEMGSLFTGLEANEAGQLEKEHLNIIIFIMIIYW